MNPSTTKTELQPSTQFRNVVSGMIQPYSWFSLPVIAILAIYFQGCATSWRTYETGEHYLLRERDYGVGVSAGNCSRCGTYASGSVVGAAPVRCPKCGVVFSNPYQEKNERKVEITTSDPAKLAELVRTHPNGEVKYAAVLKIFDRKTLESLSKEARDTAYTHGGLLGLEHYIKAQILELDRKTRELQFIEFIQQSKTSVKIHGIDGYSKQVTEAILKVSKRGVDVQILQSSVGFFNPFQHVQRNTLIQAGVKIRGGSHDGLDSIVIVDGKTLYYLLKEGVVLPKETENLIKVQNQIKIFDGHFLTGRSMRGL